MGKVSPQFTTIDSFNGYKNKRDKTKLPPGTLIEGSKNVITTDEDSIALRTGYTKDGTVGTTNSAVVSSYDWVTHRGDERHLRASGTKLEYRYVASDGTVTWRTLTSGLTSADFQFAEWWDSSEAQDRLVYVNGDSNLYMWTGGITTLASETNSTLTKEGTTSWAEEGFISSGTRQVVGPGGTVYTYTGGETTTTLTGVTPDPTLVGHSAGDIFHQAVRTTSNKPGTSFTNDLIATLNNQIYVASLTEREVFVSKQDDYTDFAFSSPRIVGEGASLTLDQAVVALQPQGEVMTISAGKNQWYFVEFVLSDDLVNESVFIKRLKTDAQSAAKTQALTVPAKNYTVYVSNEPSLEILGSQENIQTPQTRNLSDDIKNDFDTYDFTDAHLHYFKNKLYLALPAESRLLIYNFDKGFWDAPWTVPAGRLATIGGELYMHSNQTDATYKLLDGYNDDGQPIEAVARFSYQNYGHRFLKKTLANPCVDGYIEESTSINLVLYYDFNGFTSKPSFLIDPADNSKILFKNLVDGSLGKVPLGKKGLGTSESENAVPFFKVQIPTSNQDFYDLAFEINSDGEDDYWEILSIAGDIIPSNHNNSTISI